MSKSSGSKQKFWHRIQGQLILVLLVSLIPTLLITAHIFDEWYKTRREAELQANLQIARAVAKTFDTFIKDVLHQEYAIGQTLIMEKMSPEDRKHFLDINFAEYPSFLNLLWISPEGIILNAHLSVVEGQSTTDWNHIREIIAGREWTVSNLIVAKATGEPIISITRGIRDDKGQLLGIVAATIPADRLDTVLRIERPEGGAVSLVDSNGMMVFRYPSINPTWEERNWIKDYPRYAEVFKGKEISESYFAPYQRKNRLIANVPVASIGWAAGAGQTEEVAMAPITSQLFPQVLLLFIVTAAAFGAALLFSRFIANSVQRLRNHAVALGSGDTSTPVVTSGPAELQQLAEAFNEMAQRLKSREEILREQREWLSVTLSSIGDAVIATNIDGRITFLNPIAATLTGWRIEEAVGQPVQDIFRIINEQTRKPADDIVSRVLREGHIIDLANHTALITRDGREIPIEDSAAPIKAGTGKLTGVVLVFHDVTEKRRAMDETQKLHAAIRKERDTLSALINSMPDEVWFADAQQKITVANPLVLREFSLDPDSAIDVATLAAGLEVFRPDGSPRTVEEAPLLRSLKGGVIKHLEEMIRLPASGELRYRLVSSSPVRDTDGNVIGAVSVVRDITDRKRAEDALRESESKFRSLFESMSEGVALHEIIFDESGTAMDYKILDVNPGYEKHTGLQREKAVGQLASMLYGSDTAPYLDLFAKTAISGEPYSFETFFASMERHFHISASSPKPGQFVTVFEDITERKRAEQELLETHLRLRSLMNALPVGVSFSDDASCQNVTGNPAVLAQFEVALQDNLSASAPFPSAPGRQVRFFKNGREISDAELPLQRAVTENQEIPPMELKCLLPSGREWFMEASGSPILNAEGKIIGGVAVTVDITHRKRMEDELRKSRDELELRVQERTAELARSNQALQEFASIASHDLKEPLRKVAAFGNMLHQSYKDSLGEKGNDYLTRMLNATQRMQSLIDSILQLSRVTMNPEPFREVDLYDIVQGVVSDLEFRIHKTGGEVQVGELPVIQADLNQMRQLFQNLIGNALKFHQNGEKPIVRVSYKANGQGCEILVEDNGIGFEEEYIEKIFAPFQRLHGKSSQYEGTGMGLAICKKIVERHGGAITARSTPGEGSLFVIDLTQCKQSNKK